ncbi:MAG: thioesterase family protein [Burkholderiaceae bacterium]|jgi:acyl-CoA thioesterase|nr:thioesterase family protein [Burkholderiaceae bacterium]
MTQQEQHAFDQAIALIPTGQEAGRYRGATRRDYWNMVGPFGGITAAIMAQAVLCHPQRLGLPIAITVNYAAAISAGPFEVHATPVRTNRSSQHWSVQMTQNDAQGTAQINTTATLVTALRRPTWSESDVPMPAVPRPETLRTMPIGPAGVDWLQRCEMRPVSGFIPKVWDGSGTHSETLLWLRDAMLRPLDFPLLTAMSDMFYPRVWLRRAKNVPAGTVSITTYFHVDAEGLAQIGPGYLLGRAQGQRFYNGFFDQTAQLWSEGGQLLATSNQMVYFKA